jgi:DNA polymerase III subunit delta'
VSLTDTKHQPQAHRQLQRALSRDRIPHAYIFHGPEGVGKETFARGIAQLLLCGNPTTKELSPDDAAATGLSAMSVGCGTCDDCRTVIAGTHPDLHMIYRQLNREHSDSAVRKRKGLELGVDVVREFIIDKVARTPQRGRAKVFIIKEADVLNIEAQNALLKTLEEPPGSTYLILLVVGLDYLLPTTQSRCQIIRFQNLPEEFVSARLRELRPDLNDQQLEWYAAFSAGSIGEALQAVEDGLYILASRLSETISHSARRGATELIKFFTEESKVLGERFSKRDPEITDTESARRGLKCLFRLTADHYAALLRANSDVGAMAKRSAAMQNLTDHAACIERLALAEQQLDLNANVQLVIETLANELIGSASAQRSVSHAR